VEGIYSSRPLSRRSLVVLAAAVWSGSFRGFGRVFPAGAPEARPVAVDWVFVTQDGAMLVADDGRNVIERIS